MQINIITIFPEIFKEVFETSIIARAQKKGIIKINVYDLRKWTTDNHKTVDEHPFGGGAGMVMMVEPLYKAVKEITKTNISKSNRTQSYLEKNRILLTSAKGQIFNQHKARELSSLENITIICGHYEGIDQRVTDHIADEEISIGEYVLSGGEIPAMIIVDAITRLIPSSLGNPESIQDESFTSDGELEYPQYTRPEVFKTDEDEVWAVPPTLLSGHHENIKKWKEENKKNRL